MPFYLLEIFYPGVFDNLIKEIENQKKLDNTFELKIAIATCHPNEIVRQYPMLERLRKFGPEPSWAPKSFLGSVSTGEDVRWLKPDWLKNFLTRQ